MVYGEISFLSLMATMNSLLLGCVGFGMALQDIGERRISIFLVLIIKRVRQKRRIGRVKGQGWRDQKSRVE